MADAIGSTLLVPPVILLAAGGGSNGEGFPMVIVAVPLVIAGGVYLASAVHGARARSRCEDLKAQELAAQQDLQTPDTRREQRVRKPVTGDTTLHCAITEPDVGACFFDVDACAKEAERDGGACEERTSGWCFDVQGSSAASAETTCAVSQVDCDARRTMFLSDRTFAVTTCGTYSVASPR